MDFHSSSERPGSHHLPSIYWKLFNSGVYVYQSQNSSENPTGTVLLCSSFAFPLREAGHFLSYLCQSLLGPLSEETSVRLLHSFVIQLNSFYHSLHLYLGSYLQTFFLQQQGNPTPIILNIFHLLKLKNAQITSFKIANPYNCTKKAY